MNEIEAKSLFMAQYLGQEVEQLRRFKPYKLVTRVFNDENEISLDMAVNFAPNSTHLLLRSVYQLSDEEYENVAVLVYGYLKTSEWGKHSLLNDIPKGHYSISYSLGQYLLRIGVALPFTYIDENQNPVTLSVDELLNRGWINLL